ncbi:MAG: FAD:protein FMN transferase [Planctomycetaceae bacterium]|jgi:thiamine biosynthesis lipoprotein|nr:FAD:protein FMN transferase [Planctomycetaceae bacterium]
MKSEKTWKSPNEKISMSDPMKKERVRHVHGDDLMAAHFRLQIEAPAEESGRVRSVCEEFFEEIRRLESFLSRFMEDSDVSRINRLCAGESAVISQETFQCLSAAVEASRLTDGHFDVAYRSERPKGAKPAFTLFTCPHRVTAWTDGLDMDLGGIGKGFALDYGSRILQAYGYDRALLCAGTSTILALSPPQDSQGWEIVLDLPVGRQTLRLANEAVSCSGKSVRGEHIFDIRSQSYTTKCHRAWVRAETAAMADAFSTAMMTMDSTDSANFSAVINRSFY